MLKVGVIGLGNAGNQVAELAFKSRQIPAIAINSSEKDLVNISAIDKILIGDQKGAGKDRTEAKKFMKNHITALMKQEKLIKFIEDLEVIFVVSSIGGGTGSGMSPVFTEILTKAFPSKRIVLVEIYPALSESIAAQQNAIDYLKEVRDFLPNITFMAYDNHRFSNLPTDKMMQAVNAEIVEDIAVLRGDYQIPTPFSSIDEKDALRLIETPGRLCIAKAYDLKEKDLDDKSIEEILVNDLKNVSSTVELQRDKIVKRIGLISNLNKTLHEKLNTKLETLKSFVGEPVEGFEHIFINSSDDMQNRVISILSGLTIPDDRVQKMLQRIQEATEAITKVQESSILDNINTDLIDELRKKETPETTEEIDIEDTFSKYFK